MKKTNPTSTLTQADWRVSGKPNGVPPEVGKIYEVVHSRKGRFYVRIKNADADDEWATCEIVHGTAEAILDYNVREAGEEVTIRACHSLFIERNPPEPR